MHALVEVSKRILMINDKAKTATDMIADEITTLRKLLKRRIDESAGKIIKAEIKSDPTSRIPNTTVTAVITASIAL